MDLDLGSFVGATLIQIALGEAQLQFNFDRQGHGILVESGWELLLALAAGISSFFVFTLKL